MENKAMIYYVCMMYETVRDILDIEVCGTRVNYVC
mgnify:FL=1